METYTEEQILKQDKGVIVVRTRDKVVKRVLGINEGFCRFLTYDPEEITDREARALQELEGLEGIQEFLGKPEEDTIITKYIEGKSLEDYNRESLPSNYFRALKDLVMECNNRGVFRVGSKRDFLVSPQGTPAIVDFGSVLFQNDKLLRFPGVKRAVNQRVFSKLIKMEREFYETP